MYLAGGFGPSQKVEPLTFSSRKVHLSQAELQPEEGSTKNKQPAPYTIKHA